MDYTLKQELSTTLAEQDASGWADQHSGEISTFVDASVNGDNASNAAAEQRLHAVLGSFGTLLGGVLGGAAGAAIGGWLGSNAPAAKGSNQASTILDQVIIGAHEDMQTALRDYFTRAGIADNLHARNVFAKAANRVAGLLDGRNAFQHDNANAGLLGGDWLEWQKRDIWRLTVDSWDPKQAAKRVRDTVEKWAVAAGSAEHALAAQGVYPDVPFKLLPDSVLSGLARSEKPPTGSGSGGGLVLAGVGAGLGLLALLLL